MAIKEEGMMGDDPDRGYELRPEARRRLRESLSLESDQLLTPDEAWGKLGGSSAMEPQRWSRDDAIAVLCRSLASLLRDSGRDSDAADVLLAARVLTQPAPFDVNAALKQPPVFEIDRLREALRAVEDYRLGVRWREGVGGYLACCAVCGGSTAHVPECIVGQALAGSG